MGRMVELLLLLKRRCRELAFEIPVQFPVQLLSESVVDTFDGVELAEVGFYPEWISAMNCG